METRPPSRIRILLSEIQRRRVPQTALWYIGSSVAVVEAADAFLPSLGAPAGMTRLLVIVAVFGLPLALTLSWVYDVRAAEPGTGARSRRWLHLLLIGGVAALSIAGAAAVWQRPMSAKEDDNPSALQFTADPAHVAVLPFTTIGEDEPLKAFAANLQVRLIDGLSAAAQRTLPSTKRLRVVSRASILPFSQGIVSLDSLSRALKVGTVLDGTVESDDKLVRVRVRLVDAVTQDQLGTTTATASATDPLALLDILADSVVSVIRAALGPLVREQMRLRETSSSDAFNRVVMATQRLSAFNAALDHKDFAGARQVIDGADSLFAQAERSDPDWIEPTLERGRLTRKRIMLAFGQGSQNLEPIFAEGIAHAERALRRHPNDNRALELRGNLRRDAISTLQTLDPGERARLATAAERDLSAALIANPTPARALRALSELAGDNGRLQQAFDYGKRAYEEDPYLEEVAFTVFRLFEYSFALGNDAEAARWCAEGRARFAGATFDDCRLSLGAWSNAYPLHPDSAWSVVRSELALIPEPLQPRLEPRLHAMVAAVLARHHLQDSAANVLKSARARDDSPGFRRAAAGAYALLGEQDSATALVRSLSAIPSEKATLNQRPELRALRSSTLLRDAFPRPSN